MRRIASEVDMLEVPLAQGLFIRVLVQLRLD
jgi:hypothetical protein